MADNLAIKDANGTTQTIATTDVNSVHLRKVKLNDGTNDVKTGSAANLAAVSGINAALVTEPGNWTVYHAPAANTQATASKAAGGAGVRHVCKAVSFTLVAGASAPTAATATVNLRDGATGAGTILMSWTVAISAVAGACNTVSLSGLNIVGTANTAMTIEYTGSVGANTTTSVNLVGYSTT